jgi:hypothetical protein
LLLCLLLCLLNLLLRLLLRLLHLLLHLLVSLLLRLLLCLLLRLLLHVLQVLCDLRVVREFHGRILRYRLLGQHLRRRRIARGRNRLKVVG